MEKKKVLFIEVNGKKNKLICFIQTVWACLIRFDWQSAWANNPTLIHCRSVLIGARMYVTSLFSNWAPPPFKPVRKTQTEINSNNRQCSCEINKIISVYGRPCCSQESGWKKSLKPFFKNKESCAVRLIILCKWLIYPIPFMCTSKRTTRINVFCFFPNIASIAYLSLIKAADDPFFRM